MTINPEDSIQDAIDNAGSGDTIIMNTGTYNQSSINVTKELTIIGATNNPDDVIIDAQNKDRVIEVLNGVNNIKIQGLTITNGYHNGSFNGRGAGLSNKGGTQAQPTQIINCKFTNNNATGEGGAIYNYGNLIITNCTFTNNTADGNGGAISNRGDLLIRSSIIQQNTAPSFGGGIYNLDTMVLIDSIIQQNHAAGGGGILNDGELTITGSTIQQNQGNNGGGIDNFVSLTITDSTIQNNTAPIGAGIANWDTLIVTDCIIQDNTATGVNSMGGGIFNIMGTLTIIESTLQKNSAENGGGICNWDNLTITGSTIQQNTATKGGAICNDGGTLTANFNRIVGNIANDGDAIYQDSGSSNIENNWWGSNNPVFANLLSGVSNPTQWLYMTINATPTTINNVETSLITVNFNNLFDGTTVTPLDPATGHIPDGSPVTFNTDNGSIGSKTIDQETSGGIATATLTADETAGIAHITATTDAQTVNTEVTIDPKSSLYLTITPNKTHPVVGDTVIYTLKVGNHGPDTAKNVFMTYVIPEGLEFAGANVDVGTYTYNPATRTLTWNIGDVPVGDPYMWLSLKILRAGNYLINPQLSTSTYDPTLNTNTQSLTIHAAAATDNTLNAATNTVNMQNTGTPLIALILALFMLIGGMVSSKK